MHTRTLEGSGIGITVDKHWPSNKAISRSWLHSGSFCNDGCATYVLRVYPKRYGHFTGSEYVSLGSMNTLSLE